MHKLDGIRINWKIVQRRTIWKPKPNTNNPIVEIEVQHTTNCIQTEIPDGDGNIRDVG